MNTWRDETTGREVRQLTDHPDGCVVGYYNHPRHAGPHWVIAQEQGAESRTILLHTATGEVRPSPLAMFAAAPGFAQREQIRQGTETWSVPDRRPDEADAGKMLLLREDTGEAFYSGSKGEIWRCLLPDGSPELFHTLPDDLPAPPVCLTCDAGTAILEKRSDPTYSDIEFPGHCDAEWYWYFISRPRSGRLWSHSLADGATRLLVEEKSHLPSTPQPSPVDPTLIAFSVDCDPCEDQHIWAVRTDGAEGWKIRPQERDEFVMHFCWWPDGRYLSYKYQDKRVNGTHRECPFAEYTPHPTHYCLATPDGEEVYRSDPFEHWHSHVFRSQDGALLSGEGTHDRMFLYAAPFSMESTRIDFIPLATIHSPYEACAGAEVEATFTPDNQWLIYNDTVDGVRQVCAVKVEFS